MDDSRQVFKVMSLLLQYPGSDLIEALPEIEEAIVAWPPTEVRGQCTRFVAYLQAVPLDKLQIEYTARFDFDPSTCLNLTFHECGDSRKRGSALVRLKEFYKSAGYEVSTSELPDFLPLVLEFLAICPKETCDELLGHYGTYISALAVRLKDRGSPYSRPFEALNSAIGDFTGRGD